MNNNDRYEEISPLDEEETPEEKDKREKLAKGWQEINGKMYHSGLIKPGEGKREKKNTEESQKKPASTSMILRSLDKKNLNKFKEYIKTDGVSRVMQIMEEMNDSDFIKTFIFIAPYCLPKIANVDVREGSEEDKNIKNISHTVTIKDMRDGSVKVVNTEE